MRKRRALCHVGPHFSHFFITHPSQVGSTSPWTLPAAMSLYTPCKDEGASSIVADGMCIGILRCSLTVCKRQRFVGFGQHLPAQENPTKVSTSPDNTRFRLHRLCHRVLSQHIPTDVSSHSLADSRQSAPDTSSSHPCAEFHDQDTLRGSIPCFVLCFNVQRRTISTYMCWNFRHYNF